MIHRGSERPPEMNFKDDRRDGLRALEEPVLISNRHDDDRAEKERPLFASPSLLSDLQLNSDRHWHPFTYSIRGAERAKAYCSLHQGTTQRREQLHMRRDSA